MALPPVLGAVKARLPPPLLGVATRLVGAPGAVEVPPEVPPVPEVVVPVVEPLLQARVSQLAASTTAAVRRDRESTSNGDVSKPKTIKKRS